MVTIKDVAKEARVSIGTIDRVVHNRGRVSKKTIDKVKKIINELGYKPNIYARHLSLSKTYRIAVLMPGLEQDSGYWELSCKGIEKAAGELQPYHIKVVYFYYDRYNSISFLEESRKVIEMLPDGILVAPVITRVASDFFDSIPAEIPYVLFNAKLPNMKALSFIGQDPYQSGMVCGRLMNMLLGDKNKGSVAVLMVYDDYHILERAEGFKNYFNQNNRIEINLYGIDNKSGRVSFFKMIDDIFNSHPDTEGVFVANALTHYVAEYLKEKSLVRKIFLIGYDLIEKNIQYMEEGWIDFLISQKAERQGYEGLFALYRRVVLQQESEKNIMMPVDIIMKENLVYYQ